MLARGKEGRAPGFADLRDGIGGSYCDRADVGLVARNPRAGDSAVSADRVLGQIDFIKNSANFVDGIGMNAPAGVAIDKSTGHVLVADTQR